jgi:zinc protease
LRGATTAVVAAVVVVLSGSLAAVSLYGQDAAAAGAPIPGRPEQLRIPELVVPIPDPTGVRHELRNGIPVFVVADRSLPLVQITVAVASGDFQDPPERIGLAGLTGALVRRGGAGEWDPDAFDRRADELGCDFDSLGGGRRSGVTLDCGSAVLADALPLLAAMLRQPRFAADRVAQLRDRLLASLPRREDDPFAVLDREWGWLLFGREHYSTRVVRADQLAGLERGEVEAFHARYWRPEATVIAVSGDVEPAAVVAALDRLLGDWAAGEDRAAAPTPAPGVAPDSPASGERSSVVGDGGGAAGVPAASAAPSGGSSASRGSAGTAGDVASPLPAPPPAGLYLRDLPLAQAKIALGHRGPVRQGWDDRDEAPLLVLAEVLGGDGAVSRLRHRLRAEEGIAYRASARITLGSHGEPGEVRLFLETEPRQAARALELARAELLRLRDEPVPDAELELARRSLLHLFPLLFDSAERRAGRFAEDAMLGRPHDYWRDYRSRLAAVNAADVQRVARRHLRPADLIAVVVGERELVLAGARTAGVRLERLFGGLAPLPHREPLTLQPVAGEAR